MVEERIRDELKTISDVVDKFDLQTVKIAVIQADLCDLKKENTIVKEENVVLKGEQNVLKNENVILRSELNTLKNEIMILKEENVNIKGELNTIKNENVILKEENVELSTVKGKLNTLQNDVNMLKSMVMSKVGQCRDEHDLAGESKDIVDIADVNLTGTNDTDATEKEEQSADADNKPLNMGRKPKTQKKREQNEIFRKWRQTMTQRKTSENLWASGLLKVTMELWEDDGIYMDEKQILDFIQRNVEQLTTFISTQDSKQRFFLTLNKMCSIRKVSKQKFQEIMQCFVNEGPRRERITEPEVQKFVEIYKE